MRDVETAAVILVYFLNTVHSILLNFPRMHVGRVNNCMSDGTYCMVEFRFASLTIQSQYPTQSKKR